MGQGPEAVAGISRTDMRAQFLWYVAVGGLSFLTDFVVFAGLIAAGAAVTPALVAGFVVGTMANYGLSRALAFTGGRYRRGSEILRLLAVALVGLGLTAAFVRIAMALGLSAVAAKIVATPLVLGWNYLARRAFVFHRAMPVATWRLSSRAAGRARRPGRRRAG